MTANSSLTFCEGMVLPYSVLVTGVPDAAVVHKDAMPSV